MIAHAWRSGRPSAQSTTGLLDDRRVLGFYEGITNLEPEELEKTFAELPTIDGPRPGTVHPAEFGDYVRETHLWLDRIAVIRTTITKQRVVEEVSIKLKGEHPELPVAVVSDLTPTAA